MQITRTYNKTQKGQVLQSHISVINKEAMARAYESGGYTMKEIADYFMSTMRQ